VSLEDEKTFDIWSLIDIPLCDEGIKLAAVFMQDDAGTLHAHTPPMTPRRGLMRRRFEEASASHFD